MWYLYQQYAETPRLLQFLYISISMILSYAYALYLCRKNQIDTKKWAVVCVCFGTIISFLFSAVYFSAISFCSVSIVVVWLTVRKILSMNW